MIILGGINKEICSNCASVQSENSYKCEMFASAPNQLKCAQVIPEEFYGNDENDFTND